MGRYYSGDIEGKFWFAVQSSTVGERFGCVEQDPGTIDYYIGEEDKDQIIDELKAIEEKLGDELKKFHDFFNKHGSYNDEMLKEAGLDISLLQDYADYGFGQKLLKCVEENGECNFTAEL
jgi:hypothetical protein